MTQDGWNLPKRWAVIIAIICLVGLWLMGWPRWGR